MRCILMSLLLFAASAASSPASPESAQIVAATPPCFEISRRCPKGYVPCSNGCCPGYRPLTTPSGES